MRPLAGISPSVIWRRLIAINDLEVITLPEYVTPASSHVRSRHGILMLNSRHRLIRDIQKNNPFPGLHGHQVWQSSFMIMDYLENNPIPANQDILDLGCGWGLLGIFCAKHFAARVIGIDADEHVFPYLHTHAEVNNVTLATDHRRFDQISEDQLLTSDMLVGGDICFWDEMVGALQNLIQRALMSGVQKIVIADPGRQTFRRLADYCCHHFGAQLLPWRSEGKQRHSGYLLIIHNPWFVTGSR